MADKQIINVRVTKEEAAILSLYATAMGQTQTDVLRAFIRSLETRLKQIRRSRSTFKAAKKKLVVLTLVSLLGGAIPARAQYWGSDEQRCDNGEESACVEMPDQYARQRDAEAAWREQQLEQQREQEERHRLFLQRQQRLREDALEPWGQWGG